MIKDIFKQTPRFKIKEKFDLRFLKENLLDNFEINNQKRNR